MPMNIVRSNQISRLTTKFGYDDKTSSQLNLQKNGLPKI